MTWDAPVSRAHPAASSSVQLGLLAAANLLAAVMTVTGLALTAWLVQQVKNLDGWDGSHG
jgi:hypothetical protein